MRDSDELTERKQRLQKTIEQGSKLEQLYSQEDFQFFLGWIKRKLDITDNAILNGLTTDQKLEWQDKGRHTALTEVLQGAEAFADRAKKARKSLKKLETDLHDQE